MAVEPRFADADSVALPLHVVTPQTLPAALAALPDSARAWVTATGFLPGIGRTCLLPGPDGQIIGALAGYGTAAQRARGRFALVGAFAALPGGIWRIASGLPPEAAAEETLGCLLTAYAFDRYRSQTAATARLVAPDGVDAVRIEVMAAAECLTRDLINTPTNDMGPDGLQAAAQALADRHGAAMTAIVGDDLLAQNFPMIHAVGRASAVAPRLLDLRWGTAGPRLTLVGKGLGRHRGPRHQTRRVDGIDEKRHGRRGDRAGSGAYDHGAEPAGAAACIDPGRGKCHIRQCLSPAGHPDGAQRHDSGNQ